MVCVEQRSRWTLPQVLVDWGGGSVSNLSYMQPSTILCQMTKSWALAAGLSSGLTMVCMDVSESWSNSGTCHFDTWTPNQYKDAILPAKEIPVWRSYSHKIVLFAQWDFLYWYDGIFILNQSPRSPTKNT